MSHCRSRLPLALLLTLMLLLLPWAAGAQTLLDQEQRLIQIHSLLLDLPAMNAPGALAAGQLTLGLEVAVVPDIDGTTGNKRQLTASDQTPAYPRPRAALGLPAPDGFRAFVGVAYIPPVEVSNVSVNLGALEAGFAYVPGPLRLGLRGHALIAQTQSPVTDPNTRDTLHAVDYGLELAGGYALETGAWLVTPYAGVGFTHLSGQFTVSSDGVQLNSDSTALLLHAGARVLFSDRLEGIAELDAYTGRLIHPSFLLSWMLDLGWSRH
jgi:hypothetical protein